MDDWWVTPISGVCAEDPFYLVVAGECWELPVIPVVFCQLHVTIPRNRHDDLPGVVWVERIEVYICFCKDPHFSLALHSHGLTE